MGHEYKSLLICLKKRFDDCYDDYVRGITKMSKEALYESSSEITAVKEVYYEMRFWIELSLRDIPWPNNLIKEPISEQEAAAMLALENPLVDIALKWWFYTFGNKVDFYKFYQDDRKVGVAM